MSSAPSASTPPHLPTYNVRLSQDKIKTIVEAVFPKTQTIHIEQLESGKSYNNRIYFVDIKDESQSSLGIRSLVLKLAGHFFDHRKIENELGCLLLLRKYCPDVPVPEPLAWSATGKVIKTVDGRTIESGNEEPFSDHAWILTSRLAGRVVTIADLDGEHGDEILKRLAEYMNMWRTRIPESSLWGNLRIQTEPKKEYNNTTFSDLIPDQTFAVDAFLLNTFYWPNTAPYYTTFANDQLKRLQTEPQFRRTKEHFSTQWESWIQTELPKFPLCQTQSHKLTHFDFSPRNILVSERQDGQLSVMAILDFEFTGFFPVEEEFLNAMIRQSDDWEERHWNVIMSELAKLGEKVPLTTPEVDKGECFEETEWNQACLIAQIIDRLAPWEIMEGKFDEEELRRRLEEAAETVEQGIERLRLIGRE